MNGLDHAGGTLEEARLLLEEGFLFGAANRLYYALFQAIVHGFDARGLEPGQFQQGATRWNHAIVGNNIGRVVGRRGLNEKKQRFQEIRRCREAADYEAHRPDHDFLTESLRFVEALIEDLRAAEGYANLPGD